MRKLILSFFYLFAIFNLVACFDESGDSDITKQGTTLLSSSELEITSSFKNNSGWKPADKISARIIAKENRISLEFDFSETKSELLKGIIYKNDTLHEAIFKMQLLCNGKPVASESIKGKYTSSEDTSCIFYTAVVSLKANMINRIEIPFYVLENYPAMSTVNLQFRLWQDCFVGAEVWSNRKQGNTDVNYIYRDTLNKKLIDNSYSFSLSVPKIYKTQIIADSIKLQNDSVWNPYGSDNTIWKSSLPDIYFSVSDEFWHEQMSSHIERSSASFKVPDTLSYYHYDKDAIFRLGVYDHDNLSRDDVLGTWKGNLSKLKNRNRYLLRFEHVSEFYFKKIERGLQN